MVYSSLLTCKKHTFSCAVSVWKLCMVHWPARMTVLVDVEVLHGVRISLYLQAAQSQLCTVDASVTVSGLSCALSMQESQLQVSAVHCQCKSYSFRFQLCTVNARVTASGFSCALSMQESQLQVSGVHCQCKSHSFRFQLCTVNARVTASDFSCALSMQELQYQLCTVNCKSHSCSCAMSMQESQSQLCTVNTRVTISAVPCRCKNHSSSCALSMQELHFQLCTVDTRHYPLPPPQPPNGPRSAVGTVEGVGRTLNITIACMPSSFSQENAEQVNMACCISWSLRTVLSFEF